MLLLPHTYVTKPSINLFGIKNDIFTPVIQVVTFNP